MRIKILLDDLEEISYWDLESKSAISHFLENSLWKRLWICRKTDCVVAVICSTGK
jgi:hypothetical protein